MQGAPADAEFLRGFRDVSIRGRQGLHDEAPLGLMTVAALTPPEIESPTKTDLFGLLQLGRATRGLGRNNTYHLLRWGPMAVADLVAEFFETELLRATIAARLGAGYERARRKPPDCLAFAERSTIWLDGDLVTALDEAHARLFDEGFEAAVAGRDAACPDHGDAHNLLPEARLRASGPLDTELYGGVASGGRCPRVPEVNPL